MIFDLASAWGKTIICSWCNVCRDDIVGAINQKEKKNALSNDQNDDIEMPLAVEI